MINTQEENKKVVPLERHHSVGLFQLVICDGSRFGKPIKEQPNRKSLWNGNYAPGNQTNKPAGEPKQWLIITLSGK
jgi:hypothetical protein